MSLHQGRVIALYLAAVVTAVAPASGYLIEFDESDFTRTPVFNNVTSFTFTIDVAAPLASGSYVNPATNSVS